MVEVPGLGDGDGEPVPAVDLFRPVCCGFDDDDDDDEEPSEDEDQEEEPDPESWALFEPCPPPAEW